jgi:hypothetical protein
MQLISLLVTWLAYVAFPILSTEAHLLTQSEPISTADYAGIWVGHTETGEFKLLLEEHKNYLMPNGLGYDIIIGRPSYTYKGSNLKNESSSKSGNKSILSGGIDSRFPGQLSGVFHDDVNHKSVNVRLSFIDSSRNKILWRVTGENEVIITKPGDKFLPGISVPNTIVLEKVK